MCLVVCPKPPCRGFTRPFGFLPIMALLLINLTTRQVSCNNPCMPLQIWLLIGVLKWDTQDKTWSPNTSINFSKVASVPLFWSQGEAQFSFEHHGKIFIVSSTCYRYTVGSCSERMDLASKHLQVGRANLWHLSSCVLLSTLFCTQILFKCCLCTC